MHADHVEPCRWGAVYADREGLRRAVHTLALASTRVSHRFLCGALTAFRLKYHPRLVNTAGHARAVRGKRRRGGCSASRVGHSARPSARAVESCPDTLFSTLLVWCMPLPWSRNLKQFGVNQTARHGQGRSRTGHVVLWIRLHQVL